MANACISFFLFRRWNSWGFTTAGTVRDKQPARTFLQNEKYNYNYNLGYLEWYKNNQLAELGFSKNYQNIKLTAQPYRSYGMEFDLKNISASSLP